MIKMGIWVLAIALAFVAGTIATGPLTLASHESSQQLPNHKTDTDGDGVPDVDDSDDDNDGLTDEHEQRQTRTNPTRPDSDGDGMADGEELLSAGVDPRTGEPLGGTNPNDDDTDDDGFTDSFERKHGSNPFDNRSTPVDPRT